MSRRIQIMIAGAQKAGTSSLKYYLGQHPDILTHERNEIAFFIHDPEYNLGYEKVYAKYFGAEQTGHPLVLAKNAAIMYIPEAARRLREHNPHVRIIASIRNPVERAYSAYWYARRKGWEKIESFEEALDAEPGRLREDKIKWRQCAYVDRGRYYDQLDRLWEQFEKEQVTVLLLEDVQKDPVGVCSALFKGFGVSADFSPSSRERINKAATVRYACLAQLLASSSSIKQSLSRLIPYSVRFYLKEKIRKVNERGFIPPLMRPETRLRLQDYFEPHNAKLSKALGRDLSYWDRSD